MILAEWNHMETSAAASAVLACCGSSRWANQVVSSRPFASMETLLESANAVWWSLDVQDWLEAFLKHPKIGEKITLSSWSADEQRGMQKAAHGTMERVAGLNQRYEEKFGWIFIVCATGKTAEEMQALLEQRIGNQRDEELRIAAGEQAKITRLRLTKLFDR